MIVSLLFILKGDGSTILGVVWTKGLSLFFATYGFKIAMLTCITDIVHLLIYVM